MKVFTISSGKVSEGAVIGEVKIESAGIIFKAISVGEIGRGRKLYTLPVDEKACMDDGKELKIFNAELGKTQSGKPKLFAEKEVDNSRCVIVFRTRFGFRGSNGHTGDRVGMNGDQPIFGPFPGEIIGEGRTAEGIAGRMSGGVQIIAVVPRDVVFRTFYTGRLYGASPSHYYLFDGEKILAVTWEQRVNSDIF